MKTGFTLVELLVVVLIIGILSSVALPQYTLAVEKARTAEAWATLASMKTAMEVYRLASGGDWTSFQNSNDKWGLLDISLPLAASGHSNAQSSGLRESKYWTYSLESPNYVRVYRGRASGSSWTDHDYDLFIDLNGQQWSFSKPGYRLCGYITAKGQKVCKSIGTHLSGDKYLVR